MTIHNRGWPLSGIDPAFIASLPYRDPARCTYCGVYCDYGDTHHGRERRCNACSMPWTVERVFTTAELRRV